jgi:hypothetical protein
MLILLSALMASAEEPTPCPPWMVSAPSEVCAPSRGQPPLYVLAERPPGSVATTVGLVAQGVGVAGFVASLVATPDGGFLARPVGLPSATIQGIGTTISAIGLGQSERALGQRGVRLNPAPRIIGTALATVGASLQTYASVNYPNVNEQIVPFSIGAVGAALSLAAIPPMIVAQRRSHQAWRLLDEEAPRPRVEVAPTLDLGRQMVGVAGRF